MTSPSVRVVVPSCGRAGRVEVLKWFPTATIVVPPAEVDIYRAGHPGAEVVGLPSSACPGIARARQWIYQEFGDVFMLDDDVKSCVRMYPLKMSKLSPQAFQEVIDATADTTRGMGAFLFGFATSAMPQRFLPQDPFKLSGDCPGWAMGLLKGSRIRFEETLMVGEDSYASLLNAHFHRYAFFDLRFSFIKGEQMSNPGGCATYRTLEAERSSFEYLRKEFGEAVELRKDSGKKYTPYAKKVVIPF